MDYKYISSKYKIKTTGLAYSMGFNLGFCLFSAEQFKENHWQR